MSPAFMAAILEAGSSRANDVLDRLPEVRAKLVGLGLFPVGTCGADFSGSPRKIEVRWQSAAAEPNPHLSAGWAKYGFARPIRKAHRRRHREVGQGDPGCQHQGGLSRVEMRRVVVRPEWIRDLSGHAVPSTWQQRLLWQAIARSSGCGARLASVLDGRSHRRIPFLLKR
jgi:hypothetical protein